MPIKFSQFTNRTSDTATTTIVGFDGNQNIKILSSDLLSGFINGTANTIPVFATANTLGDSIITQDNPATTVTIGGALSVTSGITGDLTGDVTGNLTGNVTGNLTGDVTGDVTGNLTGDVTGNVTGNLTGNVTGDLTGSVLTAAQTNITSVGTLSSLSVSGDLTVDTNTLYVNSSNNRVGIGTTSPTAPLEVNGNLVFTSENNSITFGGVMSSPSLQITNSPSESRFSRASGSGVLKFDSYPGIEITTGGYDNVINSSGRWGIGTATPSQKLDVIGSIEVSGGIYVGGTGSANYLDDYEEGGFAPAFTNSSGLAISYYSQMGSYVKVGRQVTCWGFISVNTLTYSGPSGTVAIDGLPFVAPLVSNQLGDMGNFNAFWSQQDPSPFRIKKQGNNNDLTIFKEGGIGTNPVNMTGNYLASGITFNFTITYYTAL